MTRAVLSTLIALALVAIASAAFLTTSSGAGSGRTGAWAVPTMKEGALSSDETTSPPSG